MAQDMSRRMALQQLLKTITPNVYFQPPSGVKMEYPCIRYKFDYEDIKHSNGAPYKLERRYLLTVIDRNPDSELPRKVAMLPRTSFSGTLISDGLNHTMYNIYY